MRAVAAKDLRDGAGNAQVIAPIMILPLLFVVILPAGLLVALRYVDPADAESLVGDIPMDAFPGTEGLSPLGQVAYVSVVYFFAVFFLVIPTMISTVLAANSFAGEKERHTLEGVLYTPVSDTELIVGKLCGSAIPSVVISWLCFFLYTVLVNVLGEPFVGRYFFPTTNWWVLMVLLVPTLAVFVTLLAVWVSSRVASYQAANSIAGFVVLPIVLIAVAQTNGAMLFGPWLLAVISLVLLVIDGLLLRWIVATFDRERMVASFL